MEGRKNEVHFDRDKFIKESHQIPDLVNHLREHENSISLGTTKAALVFLHV